MHYLAIDPGMTGAIALLDSNGDFVDVVDMPVTGKKVSAPLLANTIKSMVAKADGDNIVATVEQVSSMPKQGVTSSFNFGMGYGVILGVLGTLRIRTEHVTPSKWKKDMGLSGDKEVSRRRAIDAWPDQADYLARKKDDGRAEALLLAEWQRRKNRSMLPGERELPPQREPGSSETPPDQGKQPEVLPQKKSSTRSKRPR